MSNSVISNAHFQGDIQPESQPVIGELPVSAKEFGFSGFGNGEKGHGWAGWDW